MSFDRFAALAANGGLVPVWRELLLDTDTPVSAFAKLRRGPFAFLLESAPAGGETWSRYTFLGTEPRTAWRLKDGVVEDWTRERGWHNSRRPANPIADLSTLINDVCPADVPELGQFWGGAIGYFSYDIVRLIERLPNRPPNGIAAPDALFIFTRSLVILDNLHGSARLVISVPVKQDATDTELRSAYDRAVDELDELLKRLMQTAPIKPIAPDFSAKATDGKSSMSRDDFMAGVERIKEYIRAGDCFQALLARRIEIPANFAAIDLYRALRAINP